MIRVVLLPLVIVALTLQAVTAQTDKDPIDLSGVVASNNRFALDLYQQLRSAKGNLFFSPSSIAIALSMTSVGAEGETRSELARTLHWQLPVERIHEQMKALQAAWSTPDARNEIQLSLANRLWAPESYEFLPEFLAVTREQYGAELARLNFRQSEEARQMINGWVEEQTKNKITDLIASDSITKDTKLVLTNAVHFHGDWARQFSKERTEAADFHLNRSDEINVSMMNHRDRFRYWNFRDDELKILELPYGDESLSMVVLLPDKVDGLPAIESKLTFENLQHWMEKLNYAYDVQVYLPKFKTTSEFNLGKNLEAMGMKSAFDQSTADFSGMTNSQPPLFVSKVIHKAFVDVNEEGTEAAAATAVLLVDESAEDGGGSSGPYVFRANHPFLFLIRDNRNKAIQFVGRITNPPIHNPADHLRRFKGTLSGMINVRSTLRGKLTLMRRKYGRHEMTGEVAIGSAKPRFQFTDLPDGVYDLQFRGTKDNTITSLTWKELSLDKTGKSLKLEVADAK